MTNTPEPQWSNGEPRSPGLIPILVLSAALTFGILIGIMVNTVASASASPSMWVSGEALCADSDGHYVVTWTVHSTHQGLEWTVEGFTQPDTSDYVKVVVHYVTEARPYIQFEAFWSDGSTTTASAVIEHPPPCTPETTVSTISEINAPADVGTTLAPVPRTPVTTDTAATTTTTVFDGYLPETGVPAVSLTIMAVALLAFGWAIWYLSRR